MAYSVDEKGKKNTDLIETAPVRAVLSVSAFYPEILISHY